MLKCIGILGAKTHAKGVCMAEIVREILATCGRYACGNNATITTFSCGCVRVELEGDSCDQCTNLLEQATSCGQTRGDPECHGD